ncbi:hypothetical protein AGLY_003284 [Aphis glycines]|uniref:USP domain-containing protein n=1 Tax=Aphis glycines TaxID=307491 RepID=A0A6G0U0G1_APHGL|nr:hypothetical protein AGLY_003284 [Aphis glycines]
MKKCRFNIPYPPMNETCILTPLTEDKTTEKIASTFSGSQEISAQEVVYTCLGMKQCNTSTGYIFINTSHPDKRTRMLKPMAVKGEMDPKSDDIFFDGLNEYYSCRPHSLEDVTLAEFGSNYEVRGKKKPAKNSSDSDTDNEPDTTYPIDSTLIGKPNKYIHKRKIRKIIRYVRFNVDKNEQDFYRENIMLFLPWRNEKTDFLDINLEKTQLDDNEIQIEGEQGRNNNQLVDDEGWVPDDVGDYVENTNTSDEIHLNCIHANGKSGSICFVGESINHKEITCSTRLLQDQKKNTHLEAIEVIIENITYIGIYSSPNFPVQKLCDFIEMVASTKNNFIFIGDFNINFLFLTYSGYGHRSFKEIEKYSEIVDDQIVQKEVKNNFIKPNVPAIDGFPVNSNTLKVPENCNIRSDSLLETISDNATVSKNLKTIKISSIKNKVDITSSSTFCGLTNTDGVSCYANSIIQVLFNCQSLVNEIRNNQLGPTLKHSLHEYTSNSGSCDIRTMREYLDNETILYTLQQQQDCIEFLEALMDRRRPKFESLFGFQELYTIRCNTCKHTTANNAPTSLILHFEIPQHRSQTLQTLFSTNQNVWNTLEDYQCNNCNNTGSSDDKQQIIVANEYIVIQLKLFIPTFVNGQFVPNKITDLKLSGVPMHLYFGNCWSTIQNSSCNITYGRKHEFWPLHCISETRNFQLGLR